MKYKLILLLTITVLSGCATTPSQKSLLIAAGFQARTPETEEQKAAYPKTPAYQLGRSFTKAGKTIYGYKDAKAGVVYIGNEAQYQQYKALSEAEFAERQFRHQQIAQALSETAMNIRLNSIESSQRQMQIQNMNRMQKPQFYSQPIYTQTPPIITPIMWH